ncbi:MAG: tetratricopeptide repeat protein [Myxococcales bacterium]|nr:tetratricopeptide repeat protein [Myxococcales bacterium]
MSVVAARMRPRRGPAWAMLAGTVLVVASRTAPLAAQGAAERGAGRAGRTTPAQERRVEAPAPEPRARRAEGPRETVAGPEDLEQALYLRDRPDALGEASRRFRSALLERMLASRERLVVERRREAIALLEAFVRQEPEQASEMADALLRLAELRWEQARADYLRAFAAWQALPERNRGREPRIDHAPSLALYDRILTRHRDFDRYDLVLYMKAFALVESGDTDGALALYDRILAEFPESRFVPDAHMARAEAAFSGRYDYAAALAEYEQVLRFPDSGLYDLALFKSAWCLWRLGRSREAATRFREVLDLGGGRRAMNAAERRRLRELQDEALDYLIQVFTEDERNTAADVFRFLQEIGGERYATRVLERLSETYVSQARYEQGIAAFELLLEREPLSPRAFDWQMEIATSWAALEDEEKTIAALRTLAERFAPDGAWARAQADRELVQRARSRAERAVRRQAMRWHELGQRERQRRKLERAVELYGLYLEHWSDAPSAYDVMFFRGEILFHRLERWAEAGDAYLQAVQKDPRGRFNRDALYNAIAAFERVREQEMARCAPAGRAGGGGGGSGCEETENDRKFSRAIELYVQLYPDDPDLPDILFRQGRFYYDRGVFDPAVRLFGQLIERFPQSELAAPAGELILESFHRAQDHANVERWARRLKEAPAFSSAEAQRRLDGIILESVFRIGEQLATRGAHAEAADAYLRAAEEFPDDPRARQAYYNAGLERQRAGDLVGAEEAYRGLVERYARSSEGALGAWNAAQMYESIAQFSDAARWYETYAQRFPDGPRAADAAYNAVLLRLTAGEHDEAVAAGRRFLERFPRHEARDDVWFFVGRAHEAAERWAEAARTYREYLRIARSADRRIEATTRLAQVLLRAGQRREAERELEEAVRLGRRGGVRLGEGLYFAAQARYLQGELVLREFEAVRIEGDVAGLRQRLERKSQLLARAATIYTDVVEFRVAEWVTAALYRIGQVYEQFAESLRGAPVPEGLNEEERQSYQDQLAAFVVPIEERALSAYEGGYRKALELRIYNTWTARLREALTRLNDVQYPPLREMGIGVREAAPLPMPEPIGGLRREQAAHPAAREASGTRGAGRARRARRAVSSSPER